MKIVTRKRHDIFFFQLFLNFFLGDFFFLSISWNSLLLLMHLHHSLLISWKHKSSWMIKICHSVIFREFTTFLWVMVIQYERVFFRNMHGNFTCFLEVFFHGFYHFINNFQHTRNKIAMLHVMAIESVKAELVWNTI